VPALENAVTASRPGPCQLASGPGGCWSPRQRFHVNLAVAAVTIGAVSITMSLAGLEPGNRL